MFICGRKTLVWEQVCLSVGWLSASSTVIFCFDWDIKWWWSVLSASMVLMMAWIEDTLTVSKADDPVKERGSQSFCHSCCQSILLSSNMLHVLVLCLPNLTAVLPISRQNITDSADGLFSFKHLPLRPICISLIKSEFCNNIQRHILLILMTTANFSQSELLTTSEHL